MARLWHLLLLVILQVASLCGARPSPETLPQHKLPRLQNRVFSLITGMTPPLENARKLDFNKRIMTGVEKAQRLLKNPDAKMNLMSIRSRPAESTRPSNPPKNLKNPLYFDLEKLEFRVESKDGDIQLLDLENEESGGQDWDSGLTRHQWNYQNDPTADIPLRSDLLSLRGGRTLEEAVAELSKVQPDLENSIYGMRIFVRPDRGVLAETLPMDVYYEFRPYGGKGVPEWVYVGMYTQEVKVFPSTKSKKKPDEVPQSDASLDDKIGTELAQCRTHMQRDDPQLITIIARPTSARTSKAVNDLRFLTFEFAANDDDPQSTAVLVFHPDLGRWGWLPDRATKEEGEMNAFSWDQIRRVMNVEQAVQRLEALKLPHIASVWEMRILRRPGKGYLMMLFDDVYYKFTMGEYTEPQGMREKVVWIGVHGKRVYVDPKEGDSGLLQGVGGGVVDGISGHEGG